MLSSFESIKKNFQIKLPEVRIDNIVFRLHYRYTTWILLAATILVSSRQYIGEHIQCISENKDKAAIPQKVMNTFCFFTASFTIEKYTNHTLLEEGIIPHLGVGPMKIGDEVKKHNYYQWVPFVLFGQALAFYLPHLIWKAQEGKRLSTFSEGLRATSFLKGSKTEERINVLKKAFLERLHVYSNWARWLIACEVLNALNVVLQVYLTDKFLSGAFFELGQACNDPRYLDIVFPKVAKCTFHKYGPSGTIQSHDALCVLALNIINEKIFIFLWFWYMILFGMSILMLFWRLAAWCLHARSYWFNRISFALDTARLDIYHGFVTTGIWSFSDWLFLSYLGKNMDVVLFRRLMRYLAENMDADFRNSKEVSDLETEYTEVFRKEK